MMQQRFAASILVTFLCRSCAIAPWDTVPGYLGYYGIPVESHFIQTDDGYILQAFRLVRRGAPVVMMQHGILATSWTWIANDPQLSPGIRLYQAGYDVWLTNNRGNTYSRNHTTLDPATSQEFWNFSFPVLGRHDVPAHLSYILGSTGRATLSYVGWSQGTSQMFVAMQDPDVKPLVDRAVNLFVALSPVSYLKEQKSTLIGLLADARIATAIDTLYPYGFLTDSNWNGVGQVLCRITFGAVCQLGVDLTCGVSDRDTADALANFSAHFPAGSSVKEVRHYAQLYRDHGFGDLDYEDEEENRRAYGQSVPPQFQMSRAAVPTALFTGTVDDLGDVDDVAHLIQDFNPEALKFHKLFKGFSHMSWAVGDRQAFDEWYGDMIRLLEIHNPLPSAAQDVLV